MYKRLDEKTCGGRLTLTQSSQLACSSRVVRRMSFRRSARFATCPSHRRLLDGARRHLRRLSTCRREHMLKPRCQPVASHRCRGPADLLFTHLDLPSKFQAICGDVISLARDHIGVVTPFRLLGVPFNRLSTFSGRQSPRRRSVKWRESARVLLRKCIG